jgi:hypothetical protein
MACNPSTTWYFNDWRNELTLRQCSMAARGLWFEMLCIMAASPRYGFLEIHNAPLSGYDLARQTGQLRPNVYRWLAELEAAGVFSRDESGVIFCRRMVREAEARVEWNARKAVHQTATRKAPTYPDSADYQNHKRQGLNPIDSRARTGPLPKAHLESPSSKSESVPARVPVPGVEAVHAREPDDATVSSGTSVNEKPETAQPSPPDGPPPPPAAETPPPREGAWKPLGGLVSIRGDYLAPPPAAVDSDMDRFMYMHERGSIDGFWETLTEGGEAADTLRATIDKAIEAEGWRRVKHAAA